MFSAHNFRWKTKVCITTYKNVKKSIPIFEELYLKFWELVEAGIYTS